MRTLLALVFLLFVGQTRSAAAGFAVYDIYVRSVEPLAAYQVKIQAKSPGVKIVGVEGGEHPAFKAPPFYDPKAIQREIIKLAAFSTNASEQLPVGRTRMASLHVQFETAWPDFTIAIQAAATAGGQKIRLEAFVVRRDTEQQFE